MAIYVYQTSTGALVSQIPDNITVAQAQSQGLLASNAALAAQGYAAVDGLPPLDSSHRWDAATHTVVSVYPPASNDALAAVLGNASQICQRKATVAQAKGQTVVAQGYLMQAQGYLLQAKALP